ncbi:restriction endonuclease subunit S [Sorangium sp. So ce118]
MASDWRTAPAPAGWAHCRIVDLVDMPQGQVDPRREPYSSMVLVAPDHIESNTGRLLGKETAAQQGAISGKYPFGPDTIVYSKIRPYLRKVILANFNGLCSADMYPLRPQAGVADPGFLLAILLGEHFSRFAEIVSTRTGIPKLNRQELAEYVVARPPLPEQQRIAEVLATLNTAIRRTEQLVTKLKQMKQGLLHELLTRGIDENGELRDPARQPERFKDSSLGRIPAAWNVMPLGKMLAGIDAGKSPDCPDRPAAGDEWGVLKVSAVRPDGFRANENKVLLNTTLANAAHEVRDGDLLITRANTYELVGLSCMVSNPPPRLLLCDKTLRLRANECTVCEYLFFILQMPYVRQQIESAATGSSGSMKNISQLAIRSLQIVCAPKEEQLAIASVLRASDCRITRERQEAEKLRLLKQGLMDDLLTGRVRVTPLLAESTP